MREYILLPEVHIAVVRVLIFYLMRIYYNRHAPIVFSPCYNNFILNTTNLTRCSLA